MSISSRTPEGFPSHCPLCGAATNLEFSDPSGDAPCPNCGHLLWSTAQTLYTVRSFIAEQLGVPLDRITPDTPLSDYGADSIAMVELVMELEEEFDVSITDEEAERIQTIGDAIRFLQEWRRRRGKDEVPDDE